MNAREELRLKVFELLLRNGYSLNNPEPFRAALDEIEDMVLNRAETDSDDESPDNLDSDPNPAKAGKGKK